MLDNKVFEMLFKDKGMRIDMSVLWYVRLVQELLELIVIPSIGEVDDGHA